MKYLILLISTLYCLQLQSQINSSIHKSYKLKGILEKNVTFKKDCNGDLSNKNAIIFEITVTNAQDIKKFGKKLYVATICPEMPGLGWFDGKEYDIEVLDYQKWLWEIKILNPQLFEKNLDKKIYWLENVSGKTLIAY
jgi:hypothetical protein